MKDTIKSFKKVEFIQAIHPTLENAQTILEWSEGQCQVIQDPKTFDIEIYIKSQTPFIVDNDWWLCKQGTDFFLAPPNALSEFILGTPHTPTSEELEDVFRIRDGVG
jgi:hypothetical protein